MYSIVAMLVDTDKQLFTYSFSKYSDRRQIKFRSFHFSLIVLAAGSAVVGPLLRGVGTRFTDPVLPLGHPLVQEVVEEDEPLAVLLGEGLPGCPEQHLVLASSMASPSSSELISTEI